MTQVKELKAAKREGIGKGAARHVRREGYVPAVIYGGGLAAEPISLDYKTIHRLIYEGHFLTSIFEINIEGSKQRVIPRDYQLDVVRDTPLHVDFLRLTAGSTLRVEIPVHVINQEISPALKKGGTVNIVHHTISMRVPADAIPEGITVDLASRDINETIHISDIELPPGCRVIGTERNPTLVTLTPPNMREEPASSPTPAATTTSTAAAAGTTPAAGAKAGTAAKPAAPKK